MKQQRIFRLIALAIFALIVGLLCLDIGLAWMFISGATDPACREPQPLADFDSPEEHWLTTEDGLSIRVWYYPSKNGAAILSLGGLTGSLGAQLPPMEAVLHAGYGVLQIDSRACANPAVPVTLGADEIYDAAAGLEFLLSRPEINPDRIGAIGFSMGGATAIGIAARHPEIRAVIRDGGFSNLGALLSGEGQSISLPIRLFNKTMVMVYKIRTGIDPWTVNPMGDLSAISPRPVLLIYGQHEAMGGMEQYTAAGEPKTLWIVPDGRHGQNHLVAPEEYEQRILNFFAQALREY